MVEQVSAYTNIDVARKHLFTKKGLFDEMTALTKVALNQHILKTAYQGSCVLASARTGEIFICLFYLILYVHSTIFQLCGTGLPGLNQY